MRRVFTLLAAALFAASAFAYELPQLGQQDEVAVAKGTPGNGGRTRGGRSPGRG